MTESNAKGSARWVVVLAPVPLALVVVAVSYGTRPSVSGQLTWTIARGARTLSPNDCESGFHNGVDGVVLRADGSADTNVEIFRDRARGNVARLRDFGFVADIEGRSGETFDILLENIRQTNHTYSYRGTFRVQCGSRLAGEVEFSGCHVP